MKTYTSTGPPFTSPGDFSDLTWCQTTRRKPSDPRVLTASSCWAPCQNIKSESNLVIWALLSDQQMRGLDDHFPQWRAKGCNKVGVWKKPVKPIFSAIFFGAPNNTTCIHYTVSAFFLGGGPTFCSRWNPHVFPPETTFCRRQRSFLHVARPQLLLFVAFAGGGAGHRGGGGCWDGMMSWDVMRLRIFEHFFSLGWAGPQLPIVFI